MRFYTICQIRPETSILSRTEPEARTFAQFYDPPCRCDFCFCTPAWRLHVPFLPKAALSLRTMKNGAPKAILPVPLLGGRLRAGCQEGIFGWQMLPQVVSGILRRRPNSGETNAALTIAGCATTSLPATRSTRYFPVTRAMWKFGATAQN